MDDWKGGDADEAWLVAAIERAARGNGIAEPLDGIADDYFPAMLGKVAGAAEREGRPLPEGWREFLTSRRAELRAGRAEVRLAEEGEVFGREDDA